MTPIAILIRAALIATVAADAAGADPSPIDARGPIVLAGGGREGEPGDESAWSARLYRELLAAGDITGDGRVCVALVARREQSSWAPDYFKRLGADDAFNVIVEDPGAADDPRLDDVFASVDAVFIKGGDQGEYYNRWNDRRIEKLMLDVVRRGGGIGGTSAGAMSLAQFALAGGKSWTSLDVLTDACTRELDDVDGGSAIHDDFMPLVCRAVIDTHVTQRGRLGRMAGTLAKATDDFGRNDLYAIGLDEQTGLVIRNGAARVIGKHSVSILRQTPHSILIRRDGKPPVWTDLALDVLRDGAGIRLPPSCDRVHAARKLNAEAISPHSGGGHPPNTEPFEWILDVEGQTAYPRPGRGPATIANSVAVLTAHDPDRRSKAQLALLACLAQKSGDVGLLLTGATGVEPCGPDGREICCRSWENDAEPNGATMIFCASGSHNDLAVRDDRSNSAHLVLHILADTDETGIGFAVPGLRIVERPTAVGK